MSGEEPILSSHHEGPDGVSARFIHDLDRSLVGVHERPRKKLVLDEGHQWSATRCRHHHPAGHGLSGEIDPDPFEHLLLPVERECVAEF